MQNSKHRSGVVAGVLLPMGLICLFAFCSLALALLGGRAYKQIQAGVDDGFGSTVAANYLRTKLSQNNHLGAITLRNENGIDVLVIATESEEYTYETRIYVADGRLMESSVTAGIPFQPSSADIQIARVQSCTFSLDDDGLFTAEIISPSGVCTRTAFALTEGGGQ